METDLLGVYTMVGLSSMTGYALVRKTHPDAVLEVEIRTVNHRYFGWQFQAPIEWSGLELDLQRHTMQVIRRGHVRVTIRARYLNPAWFEVQISAPVLHALLEQLRGVLAQWQSVWPLHLSVDGLLRNPMLAPVTLRTEAVQAALTPVLWDAFEEALQRVVEARKTEGRRIAEVLQRDIASIERILDTMESVWPQYLDELKATWQRRVTEWMGELTHAPDADRVWSEIALWLQKADAREELDRLRFHLRAFRDAMQTAPAGRRLDFIVQEMHREATTLASKWQASHHLDQLVELKTAIDRLREQVQNLE